MRTATNKKASTNINKSTSKSTSKTIKPIPQKAIPKKVTKPTPKPAIEKSKSQAFTHPATPITPESLPLNTPNKQSQLIALLKDPKGADIKMLMQATGWQAHSIRGVISGVIRKRLGHHVISQKVDGAQRYRIAS